METTKEEQAVQLDLFTKVQRHSTPLTGKHGGHGAGAISVPAATAGRSRGERQKKTGRAGAGQAAEGGDEVRPPSIICTMKPSSLYLYD